MSKRLLSILQYLLFLGGGIFLVWWQLKSMTEAQQKQFSAALENANYWLVIPIATMAILSHVSRSMRWKLLMEPLGYNPKLKNIFAVTMVGYLANAAIPRLGEVLKCTFLARYEKLKADKLVGTIIVERSFDLICYLIFIGITLLIQLDVIGDFAKEELQKHTSHTGLPLWGKLLVGLSCIAVVWFAIKLLFRKYPGNRVITKVNNVIRGIGEGFRSILNLKHRKAFIMHTIFIWMMYLLQIYLGFRAMDGVSHLGIKAACTVLSTATLAMIITPGGMGSFPILVMEALVIYNIDDTLGEAFGWLMWGVSTGIIVLTGFISLVALPYINKQKHEISTSDSTENISAG